MSVTNEYSSTDGELIPQVINVGDGMAIKGIVHIHCRPSSQND